MKRFRLAAALLCLLPMGAAHAQGCSACKDNVADAPAKTQQGFRRAIPVLAIPAAGLFIAMLVVSRRAGRTN
jgi:hypothetical protein